MNCLITNVVGKEEYATRLQYTEYLLERSLYLFFREMNDSIERNDARNRLIFKFQIEDIPPAEGVSGGEKDTKDGGGRRVGSLA